MKVLACEATQGLGSLAPDDEFRRFLVYLKYWTLDLRALMVYPKVQFPPGFIIKELAHLVIDGAFLGVPERVIGLAHLLEFLSSLGVTLHVTHNIQHLACRSVQEHEM